MHQSPKPVNPPCEQDAGTTSVAVVTTALLCAAAVLTVVKVFPAIAPVPPQEDSY